MTDLASPDIKEPQGNLYSQEGFRSIRFPEDFAGGLDSRARSLENTKYQPRRFSYDLAGPQMIWMNLTFGQPPFASEGQPTDSYFRGYLMVEPEDMPQALSILIRVAKKRMDLGKRTKFKILMNKGFGNAPEDFTMGGNFTDLHISDPRAAIYGESSEEVKDVLQDLVDAGWKEIEQSRLAKAGDGKRDPTSSYFKDASGEEWKSLNWNDFSGTVEDRIAANT